LSSISFLKIFRIKNNHTSIYECCAFSEKSRGRDEEGEFNWCNALTMHFPKYYCIEMRWPSYIFVGD